MNIKIIKLNNEKYLQHSKSKRFIFKFRPRFKYMPPLKAIGRNVKVYRYVKNCGWKYMCSLEDFLLRYGNDYLAKNTVCTIYDDLVKYVFENQPNKVEIPECHVGDEATIRFEYILKIPETCPRCPFYSENKNLDYSYIGLKSHCSLGHMNNTDSRNVSFDEEKFPYCRLESYLKK